MRILGMLKEEDVLKKRWPQLTHGVVLVSLMLLLGGCAFDSIQSALDPEAFIAKKQMGLFWYSVWWSVPVILGVGGVLVYAIIRFRAKPDDDSIPKQTHGNALIEFSLIGIATTIAVAIVIATVRVSFLTETRAIPTDDDVIVNVTGWQWWWAFEYPSEGIITANELHIPQGKRVILNLNSGDVLHSFWIPKLSGKKDLIPNQRNQLWFTTDETTPLGVYYGECAEFCLGAHAYMHLRVIVDTPADYEAWLASFQDITPLQQQVDGTSVQHVQADPLVEAGQVLFNQKGCASCHTIRGVAGGAPDKPDLTNFGLRTSIAAGVLTNTPENLALWLADPQAVKPGNYMPTLWSPDDPKRDGEITALVAYLESLGTQQAPQAQVGGSYGD